MEKNQLKIKYKIGGIEFEAEGPADVVEQQRVAFISGVLPAAVEAMNNTRFVDKEPMYIEGNDTQMLPALQSTGEDLSRTSLASYINQKGTLSDQDFVLFAAYYDENKAQFVRGESVAASHILVDSEEKDNILMDNSDIKTSICYLEKGMKQKFKYANRINVPFVLVLGEDEEKNNLVTLKDMQEGSQDTITIDECINCIKND